MTVWTFNGKTARWGVGREASVEIAPTRGAEPLHVPLAIDAAGLAFRGHLLADSGGVQPDRVVIHVANEGASPLRIEGLRVLAATKRRHIPRPLAAAGRAIGRNLSRRRPGAVA